MAITDNPYIDLLVQCTKILGMNSVVKNENEAMHYEDIRSSTEAYKLIKYKQGNWDRNKDGIFNPDMYMEWNSYYRMLNGLPPAYTLNDEKAYLTAVNDPYGENCMVDIGNGIWVIPEMYDRYFISMDDYIDYVPEDMYTLDLEGKYLHELSEEDVSKIDACGILDMIKDDPKYQDSHYEYIYHLGDKRVDYYTARTAENFSLLFAPTLTTFSIIEQKYRRFFDRNRRYTIATVYSDAYRFMSYHYDAFIVIMLVIQTMVDLIMEVQEYIINKDVFDNRTIRYLFESYGVEYYKEIPINYQIRIIKNINRLIKYKSSNRNIMDIIELFDSPDINVYTYYLMKTKKIDRSEFRYYTKEDINPKYKTNRTYYLGDPMDKSNNRYPVMYTRSDENSTDFITNYIYRPILDEDGSIVGIASSILADMYIDVVRDYMVKISYYGVITTDEGKERYLNTMLHQILGYIYEKTDEFGTPYINKYNNRYVKYRVLYVMGLMPELTKEKIDSHTDDELYAMIYDATSIEDADYTLNHTIPYFIGNDDTTNYYVIDGSPFNSITPDIGEQYDNYCWMFRNAYRESMLNGIENLFLNIENNYYDGWIDESFIREHVSNIQINEPISTVGYDDLPVYKDSTIGEVVTEDMVGLEYCSKNYDLCFLKVPITNPNANEVIEDQSKRHNYDQITFYTNGVDSVSGDPFWDGVSTQDILTDNERDKLHESKKKDILDKDFSIERTKYIAVEASIDLTKMSYQTSYFLNMLYDKHMDEESLVVDVDKVISPNKVKLNDLLTFAIALNYLHNGVEPDNIGNDMERNMIINGFNFDTDWTDVYNSLENACRIYNNYQNELHEYEYTDENGEVHHIDSGYGMETLHKGYLTELYKEYYMYTGPEAGQFITHDITDWIEEGYQPGDVPINPGTDTDSAEYLEVQDNYRSTEWYVTLRIVDGTMCLVYTNEQPQPPDPPVTGVKPIIEAGDRHMEFFTGSHLYMYYDDQYIGVYTGNPNGDNKRQTLKDSDSTTGTVFNEAGSREFEFSHESAIYNYRHILDTIKILYSDPSVGAFLSGRYESCEKDDGTECAYLTQFKEYLPREMRNDFTFGSSDIWNYNLRRNPIYDWTNGKFQTLDISWETQYPEDDNNSHGLFLNTSIFNKLTDENVTDTERYNLIKAIYTSNTNLYDHLVYMMRHAESKRMYDIYKIVFESFMETKMNHDFYRVTDNDGNYMYRNKDTGVVYTINQQSRMIVNGEFVPVDHTTTGFPDMYGYEWDNDVTHRYVFEHNADFSQCVYRNVDNGVVYQCITNPVSGEYEAFEDVSGQISRTPSVYFVPTAEGIKFEVAYETVYYLDVKDDPSEDTRVYLQVDYNDEPIIPDEYEIKIADDYYEFLQFRNPDLYAHLIDLKYNYKNEDDKRTRIEELCTYIAIALEEYFDTDQWKYIFNLVPTSNIENVQSYIIKMVMFFKSWKTQTLTNAVDYVIDSPFENYVQILDDVYHNSTYNNLTEKLRPNDFIHSTMHTAKNDVIKPLERVVIGYLDYGKYINKFDWYEKMYSELFEQLRFKSSISRNDVIRPIERVTIKKVTYQTA